MAGEYKIEDLHLLKILRDKKDLEGTAYFEFHPRNLKSEYSSWNEGSIYLADSGFDFFCDCFYRSNREFDYFAFCKYNGEEINRLVSELEEFMRVIQVEPSRSAVFSRYSGLFGKEMWDEVSEARINEALVLTGSDLVKFFKAAKNESGILWVLGM